MTESVVLRGGRVIDPRNGVDSVVDLLLLNGKVAKVGSGIESKAQV